MIFTLQHSKADMQAFYADIKRRVATSAAPPEDCVMLPSVDPIIGETESIARERQAYINEMVDPEVGAGAGLEHIGVDLSKYRSTSRCRTSRSRRAHAARSRSSCRARAHGLTLGEAAGGLPPANCARRSSARRSRRRPAPGPIRSPRLRRLHPDADVLSPAPGKFVRGVVPELQRRGVFRNDYTGRTLASTFTTDGCR